MRGSLQAYRKVDIESQVAAASPHRLVQMLFNGALERLARTRYAMEQNDMALKGEQLNKAQGIISGLRGSLDMEQGGEISQNLDALYDYMTRQLAAANMANDVNIIDEISGLLREVKAGWDAIPADMHHK
ncbi:flagellar export chaperone FliS [Paraferrimonas sedimenticola]|uniref:flagellar export chaperone FliS n=1 Tax=Paraferrimonas sedimenticola TaxID=375674 RepID=UPI000BA920B4|nr:flagellar export chaperone FliS [Paraferrimonas sedimenticola]